MLTPQLRKAMLYIQEYVDASGGVPPTYLEIAQHFGHTHKSNAHGIVHNLQARGYLRTLPNRARAIKIVQRVEPIYAAYVFDDVSKELRRM